ncbi:MAG: hypothetical protein KIT84_22755 [Labilithrix sp.]|nr:hypothetical protein [Labilithrix sp.]MCW5813866.1 hypothetical protein [Labilithrix sp.]
MVGRVVVVVSVLLLPTAACKTSSRAASTVTPTVADPYAGANCAAVRAPREPELMAWDAESRAQLDKLRRRGVVAVRYQAKGCEVELELLPGCVGPKDRYVYSPMSSADTRTARTIDELLAQLPVGASNLSMTLGGPRVLRADYKLVGAAALPVGSTITEYDLVGLDCKKATHVVSAVYVGGFAVAQASPNATDNVFSGGGEALTREGFAPICQRAEAEGVELSGCSAPLRVALLPLNGEAPPPTCPEGWTFDGKRCAKDVVAETLCSTWGGAEDGCTHADPDAGAGEERVFDASTVERVVREKSPHTKRNCWEAAPAGLRKLSVTIFTTLSPDGKVASAEAQGITAEGNMDTANVVARCIANDVMTWEFPAPDAKVTFQLPFHLLRQ